MCTAASQRRINCSTLQLCLRRVYPEVNERNKEWFRLRPQREDELRLSWVNRRLKARRLVERLLPVNASSHDNPIIKD